MIEFKDIKLVALDVDGTLTNGIYQISSSREVVKSFYTRDFSILEELMRNQIQVVIITQSHDMVIFNQIDRICSYSDWWTHCFCQTDDYDNLLSLFRECDDKFNTLFEHLKKVNLDWSNVAYMGDAENDLEPMHSALFTGCPADAIQEVKDNSNYISRFNGGRGAVYDFGKYILEKGNKWKIEKKQL